MSGITRFFSALNFPLKKQPVMFCWLVVLLGIRTLQYTYGYIMGHDVDLRHNLLMFIDQTSLVFLFAYILTTICTITRYRVVKILIYIVAFSLFCIEQFLYKQFQTAISPNILLLLAETNGSESSDFIKVFMTTSIAVKCYIVDAIILMLICISEYLWCRYLKRKVLSCHIYSWLSFAVVCFCFSFGLVSCSSYYRLFQQTNADAVSAWKQNDSVRPLDTISNIIYSYWDLHVANKELSIAIETTQRACKEVKGQNPCDSIYVVCVIGESYIKRHSSLYGYYLHTCPYMEQERDKGNLYVFNDVVSPFFQTSRVVRNVLYCNDLSSYEHWYDTPFLPALYRASGYHVSMVDNQRCGDPNVSFNFSLNSLLYSKSIMNMSYDYASNETFDYDGDLIDWTKDSIMNNSKAHFVVYHLIGQHLKASSHYPHDTFEKFDVKDIKGTESWWTEEKKKEVADYDNATLYNDFVLKKIFDIYRNENAFVIYFSDHGEEVYDYRDSMGRTNASNNGITKDFVRCLEDVPFIIWVSDSYKEKHHDIVKRIQESTNYPMSIDNVCQLFFSMSQFRTSYYKPERDILNHSFVPQKRKMLFGGYYEDYFPKK